MLWVVVLFFFQAEDGIRDLVRSRGLGDVYKRQVIGIGAIGRDLDAGLTADAADGAEVAPDVPGRILSLIHI